VTKPGRLRNNSGRSCSSCTTRTRQPEVLLSFGSGATARTSEITPKKVHGITTESSTAFQGKSREQGDSLHESRSDRHASFHIVLVALLGGARVARGQARCHSNSSRLYSDYWYRALPHEDTVVDVPTVQSVHSSSTFASFVRYVGPFSFFELRI
jgi:hypothetical protein